MLLRKKRVIKPLSKLGQKPFIEGHEKLNDGKSLDRLEKLPLSSTIPINAHILKMSVKYRDELPVLLEKRMKEARDFFLKELAPLSLAVSNGLLDAKDVLKEALQEDPEVDSYLVQIEDLLHKAMEVKMTSFVKKIAGLDDKETRQFLVSVFTKEFKNEDVATLLSKMLSLSDLQRPGEEPKVPVRQVSRAKRGRVNSRAGRVRASSKG